MKGNDSVTITSGATVALNIDDEASNLTIADGALQVDGNVVLALNDTFEIGSPGNVQLNAGQLLSARNSATVDGTLTLNGGTFSFDTAGQGYSISGGGTVKVQAGTFSLINGRGTDLVVLNTDMEISGGTVVLDGQVYFGNGVPTELKVVGDSASIDIARLNQNSTRGNSGTFHFVLDETGVSTIDIGNWVALANLALVVDGSTYAGGAEEITLINAPDSKLLSLVETNNISLTGFAELGLEASIEQDVAAGDVRLVLTTSGTVYDSWASGNSLAGADAEMTADPDGDGVENLFEFARGSSPALGATDPAEAANYPKCEPAAEGVEYIYRRRRDAQQIGLSYTLETVSNLVSGVWSTNGVIETGTSVVDSDYETVTNHIPVYGAGFVRQRVELEL